MSSIKYSKSFINKITSNLDQKLVEYYQSKQGKNKAFDVPLESLVEQVFIAELDNTTDRSELRKIATAKKKVLAKKKSRYYKSCSDMVETDEWKNESDSYFYRDALTVFNMTGQLVLNGHQYQDFPEMEQAQLEVIRKWSTDDKSRMIDYPGQEKRTPRAVFVNFLLDLTINVLQIIASEYDYDIASATYAVVDDLSNQALFANSREILKKEDLTNGKFEIYQSVDGTRKTVLTFPPDLFDKRGYVTLFDSKDLEILSYLILLWDIKRSSIRPLSVRIIDIFHAISGNTKTNPSSNQYEDIWNRVYKMYALGFESYNNSNVTAGRRLIAECERDEKNNIIYYVISEFLYEEFTNNKIRKMPAEQLNRLENKTARILYYPFMKQRVSAYETALEKKVTVDSYPMYFQYEHFLRWVNFGNGNLKDNHNVIIEALDEFQEKGIFIRGYKYLPRKRLYYIEFYPLSEVEIQDLDFYFNKQDQEDTEEVIEQLSIFTPLLD